MTLFVIISQAILYCSLALLIGFAIMQIVPSNYKPDIFVPERLLLYSAYSIPIVTFIPVFAIILYIAPRVGLIQAFQLVLSAYTVGLAWTVTLLLSALLILLIRMLRMKENVRPISYVWLIIILFAIIGTIAWSSHATALQFSIGIVSDFIHLAAVSVWGGILIVVAFFTRTTSNWLAFLKWFTIVALTCLGLTAVSGFLLIDVLVDDYVSAWAVSYGQGIFLKHLFILPLLFYALINGLIVKFFFYRDPQHNPKRGIRVEAIIIMTMFILTAIFSQSSPPHGHYLTPDAISPLFSLWHDTSTLTLTSNLIFTSNAIAIILVFTALLLFIVQIIAYVKRAPVSLLLAISTLLVASIYGVFMLSISIQ